MSGNYYPSVPTQQPGMMDPMNSGMMSPGFNQSPYTAQQGAPMMQGMHTQTGYMPQQAMAQGAQQFSAAGR